VTFDRTRIKSLDWSSYQIIRFTDTPDSVEVEVIDRPGQPFLGTGEVSQGPAAAAIANAVANATGQRLRELPFTRAKVKSGDRCIDVICLFICHRAQAERAGDFAPTDTTLTAASFAYARSSLPPTILLQQNRTKAAHPRHFSMPVEVGAWRT
jgi:hypothetical protein